MSKSAALFVGLGKCRSSSSSSSGSSSLTLGARVLFRTRLWAATSSAASRTSTGDGPGDFSAVSPSDLSHTVSPTHRLTSSHLPAAIQRRRSVCRSATPLIGHVVMAAFCDCSIRICEVSTSRNFGDGLLLFTHELVIGEARSERNRPY